MCPRALGRVTTRSYHTLLNTNEPPSGSEITFVHSVISKADARVARIDEEVTEFQEMLKHLRAERASLYRYRKRNRGILSPLRRMPSEMLGEIFALTVPLFMPPERERNQHGAEPLVVDPGRQPLESRFCIDAFVMVVGRHRLQKWVSQSSPPNRGPTSTCAELEDTFLWLRDGRLSPPKPVVSVSVGAVFVLGGALARAHFGHGPTGGPSRPSRPTLFIVTSKNGDALRPHTSRSVGLFPDGSISGGLRPL